MSIKTIFLEFLFKTNLYEDIFSKMEAPQGKVSTAWTSQLGFSPLEYSTSNVTDCGICKRIIDYTVQLGPDQSLNLSTSILSIILLFSLVFLLFFLSRF